MYKDLQLPSDFLIDNHKSLGRRNDFEDLCESLDDLQHEAMSLAFQDGFNQAELNTLRQFVEGKLATSVQDIQLDVAEQDYLNGELDFNLILI